MDKKTGTGLAVVIIICLVILAVELAAMINPGAMEDDEFAICSLAGLSGVKVRVQPAFWAFEDDRLNRDPIGLEDLEALAQMALAQAGIDVFANTPRHPDIGELVIRVDTWKTKIGSQYIVQVRLEVYQLADLVRSNQLRIRAVSWPAGERVYDADMTAVVSKYQLRNAVHAEVARQIGMFVDDYLRANPQVTPMMTGTIRYLNFEGGFYGIVADKGTHYLPTNLPLEFAKHGLRVKFQVKEKGLVTCDKWGKVVDIIKISEITPTCHPCLP